MTSGMLPYPPEEVDKPSSNRIGKNISYMENAREHPEPYRMIFRKPIQPAAYRSSVLRILFRIYFSVLSIAALPDCRPVLRGLVQAVSRHNAVNLVKFRHSGLILLGNIVFHGYATDIQKIINKAPALGGRHNLNAVHILQLFIGIRSIHRLIKTVLHINPVGEVT